MDNLIDLLCKDTTHNISEMSVSTDKDGGVEKATITLKLTPFEVYKLATCHQIT